MVKIKGYNGKRVKINHANVSHQTENINRKTNFKRKNESL